MHCNYAIFRFSLLITLNAYPYEIAQQAWHSIIKRIYNPARNDFSNKIIVKYVFERLFNISPYL